MKLRLRKPSPAMVVACISLFIGLSGVSTAAVVVLKKNSVLSKHIKNGQVKRVDVGANAVNSGKVLDGSLLGLDFAAGQLPAGPPGPTAAAVGGPPPPGPGGPAPADQIRSRAMITTTVAGKLLVSAQLGPSSGFPGARVSCEAAGPCNLVIDIYVDGAPVPETARTLNALASGTAELSSIVMHGLVSDVPAGTHTVDLMTHRSALVSDVDLGSRGVQAIAVG